MKNLEVITMIEGGILSLTAHSLDVAHAYKLAKFKSELKKTYNQFVADNNALLQEVGIEDPYSFDARRAELLGKESLTKPEKQELAEFNAKFSRLSHMRDVLGNEPVTLDGVKTMPYEQWFLLQKENKDKCLTIDGKSIEILTLAEPVLEGVLWAAPEE